MQCDPMCKRSAHERERERDSLLWPNLVLWSRRFQRCEDIKICGTVCRARYETSLPKEYLLHRSNACLAYGRVELVRQWQRGIAIAWSSSCTKYGIVKATTASYDDRATVTVPTQGKLREEDYHDRQRCRDLLVGTDATNKEQIEQQRTVVRGRD